MAEKPTKRTERDKRARADGSSQRSSESDKAALPSGAADNNFGGKGVSPAAANDDAEAVNQPFMSQATEPAAIPGPGDAGSRAVVLSGDSLTVTELQSGDKQGTYSPAPLSAPKSQLALPRQVAPGTQLVPASSSSSSSPSPSPSPSSPSLSSSSASPGAPASTSSSVQYAPHQVYDPDVADEAARFKKLVKDEKFKDAVKSVQTFFLASVSRQMSGSGLSVAERDKASAAAVKQLLIELGPTFIKLGQFLSVRRDLLPVVVADELTSLQDRVPPFGVDTLREIVTKELGAPPEELFAYFDPVPMASASIGQVHRVQLRDGRQAVLKVQRQDLARQFYRDLGLMRFAAKTGLQFDHHYQKLRRTLRIKGPQRPARFDFRNWLDMSDEFGRNLFSEIDYLVEGRNADRLRKLLRERTDVRVPRVIWKYSGRRVLTLEYIEGVKIDKVDELRARGIDPAQVGSTLITCYLEQFVLKGFFHADPHAGNLAVDDKGCLIIYDFGMVGEITEAQRRALLSCVISTVKRDSESLVRGLHELGVVRSGTNHEAIGRALAPFMDYYAGKGLFDLDFRQLEHDIDTVVTERSLRLPANLAYILRAGSALEGIARTLKSDFSFSQAVRPVIRKLVAMEGMESLSTLEGLMQLAGLAVSGLKRGARETAEIARSVRSPKKNAAEENPVLPGAPAECSKCRKHVVDKKRIAKQLRMVGWIGIGYTGLSLGTILLLNTTFLANYASPGFYLVIGNIILGGIMIWKFATLLRGSSNSTLSDHGQRNGEKKC